MSEAANKRIAKNTIYMYIKLFTTMVLGLYISRVVLQVLGISDFGLFSLVGGILAMFTFISGSLTSATSRFLNYEMGISNGNVNRSFNINLLLHIIFALIILVLAETIGLWYINNKLNVAPDKIGDAIFVYQVSIVTACLGIINNPYASLFGAFERFKFLTLFDIINTVIRLIFVILLQYYEGNSLRFYSIIMGLTTANAFIVYHWLAAKKWPSIIKLKLVSGWKNYKEVLVFSNWNLFATMALMARSTGTDLILNLFFGTAINGAFAVSKTVNNYVTTFSTNFDSASGPQIIQSYSTGDLQRSNYLVNKLGRLCLLLFVLIFFPLYIELDFVLHLWLKDVPDGVLIFCQLNLILAAVALTGGGLVQLINASGKIKWFKISGSAFFLLSIPAGYILFQKGAPTYSILILFIVADIMNRIVQLILMKTMLGFDTWRYIKDAYFSPSIIALIMTTLLWAYSLYQIDNSYYQFMSIVVCFLINAFLIYTIGLTSGEKNKLLAFAKNKIGLTSGEKNKLLAFAKNKSR